MCPFETNVEREVRRRIRADWLRRKDFVEFALGTKCSDEIPDTASANIDSPSVPNPRESAERTVLGRGFSKGPRDRNINVPACALRCCTNCGNYRKTKCLGHNLTGSRGDSTERDADAFRESSLDEN